MIYKLLKYIFKMTDLLTSCSLLKCYKYGPESLYRSNIYTKTPCSDNGAWHRR